MILRTRCHRALHLLLPQRLVHVLFRLLLDILELKRALLTRDLSLLLQVNHLVLQKRLNFLVFPPPCDLISFFLNPIASCIVINYLAPELVLCCVLHQTQVAGLLGAAESVRPTLARDVRRCSIIVELANEQRTVAVLRAFEVWSGALVTDGSNGMFILRGEFHSKVIHLSVDKLASRVILVPLHRRHAMRNSFTQVGQMKTFHCDWCGALVQVVLRNVGALVNWANWITVATQKLRGVTRMLRTDERLVGCA